MTARSSSSDGSQSGRRPDTKTAAVHAARAGEPPRYLVYFRERHQDNESLLRDVLSLRPAAGERAAAMCSSIQMLEAEPGAKGRKQAHGAKQAPARILGRLAIGVVSADQAQLEVLRRSPLVAAVEANEQRHIQMSGQSELLVDGAAAVREMRTERLERLYAGTPTGADPDPFGAVESPPREPRGGWLTRARPVRAAGGYGGHLFPWSSGPTNGSATALDATHSWCLDLVGVHRGYRKATGRGVTVAVVDTGIDLGHSDFQGRFRTGTGDTAQDTAVSFVDGEDVQDHVGHGTHCAGVVGGPAESAGGMRYGVAPEATLLVGKALNNDGRGWDSDILEAIEWAADRGARVVSMSLGAARGVEKPYSEGYERVGQRLLEEHGVLLVTAAGNDSSRPSFVAPVGNPAACPSFMAVAAVDDASQVAPFSCGQRDLVGLIDVAGPGTQVYSSVPGGYRLMSGTSMATPHAAGIAVLWLSFDPSQDPYELWWNLEQHAKPLGDVRDTGRGVVQAP